jgi:hypothetical protein
VKLVENTFESPLKKTAYLSDGAAVQYRNRKHLLNITCHNEDYGIPAQALLCEIPWEECL